MEDNTTSPITQSTLEQDEASIPSVEPEIAPSKPKLTPVIIAATTFAVLCIIIVFLLLSQKIPTAEPGKIIFADQVTEVARDFVNTNLQDIVLESDLSISTQETTEKLADDNHTILYNILLPVTDFYDSTISIPADAVGNYDLISIWDLNISHKLLAIDDEYYLDTFSSGALFEYYILDGAEADLELVSGKLRNRIDKFPDSSEVLTFAQTGVTALSRRMNARLNQIKDASLFAANIGEYLSQFDLTHTSNEASFSNSATSENICSKPAMIDTLTTIGLDIVELTGNHNQDCGDADAIATIDLYHSLGIQTFGGGKTAAEAAIPLEIEDKGTSLTLLGYNYSTGGYTTDNTPGANLYTDERAKSDITTAKARGDIVIVDIQFFECNAYASTVEDTTCDYANSSAGDQISFSRHLVDLGADIVVGTSAHQPQTYEIYHDSEIFYGLGNLFFDQSWWPGTTRSLILVHYFYDNQLLQTRVVPTIYNQTYQTKLMETSDAQAFLKRLISARPQS